MEDLSEIRKALKEEFGPRLAEVGAADIQLCDQRGSVIEKWESINSLQDNYFREGGICLVVGTLLGPHIQLIQHGHAAGMFYGVSLYILK